MTSILEGISPRSVTSSTKAGLMRDMDHGDSHCKRIWALRVFAECEAAEGSFLHRICQRADRKLVGHTASSGRSQLQVAMMQSLRKALSSGVPSAPGSLERRGSLWDGADHRVGGGDKEIGNSQPHAFQLVLNSDCIASESNNKCWVMGKMNILSPVVKSHFFLIL